MPTKLAQWERERFLYGDAAGDGKGDQLRIHAIKAEHSNNLLFSWLSGGVSEVRLPDTLPMSRGGTGATTAAGVLKNLGFFEDTNHMIRRGVKVLGLADNGILDRFGNLPEASFTKKTTGEYIIRGVTLDNTMFGMIFPLDMLHQLRYIATTALGSEGEVVVKVFKANNTTNPPSAGVPADLPARTFIDIECK